jgi:hypothetical protein
MLRRRFFSSALLIVAMLVVTATPAFAAIQVRLVVGGPYTFSHGQPIIVAFVDCTDSVTGSDLRSAATLTVTLTQGHRSVTRTKDFQCWGDDDIVIGPFRGFHPGLALIDATLTACDAENLTDCATTRVVTETAFVIRR